MSDTRLLIDLEVFEFLRQLPRRDQETLLKRFREIAAFPSRFSDFSEPNAAGRRVEFTCSVSSLSSSGTTLPTGR